MNTVYPQSPQNAGFTTKSYSRLKLFITIFFVVLLVSAVGNFYLFNKVKQFQIAQMSPADQVKEVVAEIGKFIILPSNETPTLATVSDLEPLKGQPFFAHTKIGDKVLIYTNAQKAILYDPQADKIVDVAPLSIGNNAR